MEKAKNDIAAYEVELNTKIRILEDLLNNYNDGRRKGFFCLAVNLLDLVDITLIMERLKAEATPESTTKEKAATAVRLFQALADGKGIVLKLRK
jgi:hypothetical protein